MNKKIKYSLLITAGLMFVCLFFLNLIFGSIFGGELGIYVSMFATTIFIIIYCTLLILSRLDKKDEKSK